MCLHYHELPQEVYKNLDVDEASLALAEVIQQLLDERVMFSQCWLGMLYGREDAQPSRCSLWVQVVSSHADPPLARKHTQQTEKAANIIAPFVYYSSSVFLFSSFPLAKQSLQDQLFFVIRNAWLWETFSQKLRYNLCRFICVFLQELAEKKANCSLLFNI